MIAGILDFVALARPSLLLPVWLFLFAGYFWATGGKILQPIFHLAEPFYLILISYSLMLSAAYVINQIADVESDRINKKLFLLPEGIISIRAANIYAFGLVISSIALAFFADLPKVYYTILAISLTMGLLYSVKPISLKDRPFLDLIANAAGYGVVNFLAGWIAARSLSPGAFLHALPYFFAVGASFLNTTIPDIPGDKAQGKLTTGVFLGRSVTTFLALIFLLLALFSGLFVKDLIITTTALLSLPFFILAAFRKGEDEAVKISYRISAGILAILYGIHFPLFLILVILTVTYLKLYYKFRFGLDYPTLKGR